MINSLGNVELWQLRFRCAEGLGATKRKMRSPKAALRDLKRTEVEERVKAMAEHKGARFRLKQFFINEYYPAIIHTNGKMVVLEQTVEDLIDRAALSEHDRDIVEAVVAAAPEWFTWAA
jgi:hypothetical protein